MACKFTATGKGFPAETIFQPLGGLDDGGDSSLLQLLGTATEGCTDRLANDEARALCVEEEDCDMYAHHNERSQTCFYKTDSQYKFLDDHNFVSDEGDSYFLDCSDAVAAFSSSISEVGEVSMVQEERVNKYIEKYKDFQNSGTHTEPQWMTDLETLAKDLSACEIGAGDYRCDKDVYVPQHRDKGVFMCDETHYNKDGVSSSAGLSSRILNVSQEQCYEACDAVRKASKNKISRLQAKRALLVNSTMNGNHDEVEQLNRRIKAAEEERNRGLCSGVAYWRTGKRSTMNTMQFYADMQADAVRLQQTETCLEWLPPFLGKPGVCLDGHVPNTKVRSVVVDTSGLVREYGSTLYHKPHLQRALRAGGMQGVCTISEYSEIIDGVKNTDQQYKMHGCAMMLGKVFDNQNTNGKVVSERIVEDAVTSQKSRWKYIGEGFCRTKTGKQIVTSDKTAGSTFEIAEPGSDYRVGDRLELTTEQTCSGSAGNCEPAILQVTNVNNGGIVGFDVEVKGEGYLEEPTAKPNGYEVSALLNVNGTGSGAMFKVRTMSMPTCQKSCGENAKCMAMSYDEWTSFYIKNPTWSQKVQTKTDEGKCTDSESPCYAGYDDVCVSKERWSLGLDAVQCSEMITRIENNVIPNVERGAYGDVRCKVGNLDLPLGEEKCIEFQDAIQSNVHHFPAYNETLGCQVEWCPKVHLPNEDTRPSGYSVTPSTGQCLSPYPNDSSCTAGGYTIQDNVFVETVNPECAQIHALPLDDTNNRGQSRQDRCELAQGCVWSGRCNAPQGSLNATLKSDCDNIDKKLPGEKNDQGQTKEDQCVVAGCDWDGDCGTGRVAFTVRSVGSRGEITNVVTPDTTLANNMLRTGSTYPIRAEQCFKDGALDPTKTTKAECVGGGRSWSGGHGSQLQPTENVNCVLYGGDERYTQVDVAGDTFAAYDFTPYTNGKCMGVDYKDASRYVVRDPETKQKVTRDMDPLLCLQKCQMTNGCNAVNFAKNADDENGSCIMLGKCVEKDVASGNWKYSKMTSNAIVLDGDLGGDLDVLGPGQKMIFPLVEYEDPRTCEGCSSTTVGKWLDFYETRVPHCDPTDDGIHQLTCEENGNNICGLTGEYAGPKYTPDADPNCRASLSAYKRGTRLDDATQSISKWIACPHVDFEANYVNTEAKCATQCREDPTCAYFTYTENVGCQIYTHDQCNDMIHHDVDVINTRSVTRRKEFPASKSLNIKTSKGRACWSKESESKYLNSLLITPEWRGDDRTDKSTCVLLGERTVFTKVQTKRGVDKGGVLTCTIPGKPCWAGFHNGCYAEDRGGKCPVVSIPPKHRDDILDAIYGTDEMDYQDKYLEGDNEVLSRTQCTNVCSTDRSYACVDSFGAADPAITDKTTCESNGDAWTNVSASCSYGKTELSPYALVNPTEGLPVESLMLSDMDGKMHHRGGTEHPLDECDDPLVAGSMEECQKDYDLTKMGPMRNGFTISDIDARVKVTGYSEGQEMDCTVDTSLSAEKQQEECALLGGTCGWIESACSSTVHKETLGEAKVLCSIRLDDHTFLFETDAPKNKQGQTIGMPTNHVFNMEMQVKDGDGHYDVQKLDAGKRCQTDAHCASGRCDTTGSYGCYGRCITDEARTTKPASENCPFDPPEKIAEAQCEDKLRFIASRIRPTRYAEGFARYQRQRPKKQPVGALCGEAAHCESLTCGTVNDQCKGVGNYAGFGKRCVDPNVDPNTPQKCPFALGTRCSGDTDCATGLYCATAGECHGRCTTSGRDGHCPSNLQPLTSDQMNNVVGLDEHGCGPFTDTIEDAVRICGDSAPRDTARCMVIKQQKDCTAPCVWDGDGSGVCRADPRIKKCNAFLRFENRHAEGNNKTCYYSHTGPQLEVKASLEPWEIREPGQVGAPASGDTFVQQITQPFMNNTATANDAFSASVRPYEWDPRGGVKPLVDTLTCKRSNDLLDDNIMNMRFKFDSTIMAKYKEFNDSNLNPGKPKLTQRVLRDGYRPNCDEELGCCPNATEFVRYGGDPFGSICTNINTLMPCQLAEQNIPTDQKERWEMLCNLTRGYRSQGTWTFVKRTRDPKINIVTRTIGENVYVRNFKYTITEVDNGVPSEVNLVESLNSIQTGFEPLTEQQTFVHPTSETGEELTDIEFTTTFVADLGREEGKQLYNILKSAGVADRGTAYPSNENYSYVEDSVEGGYVNTGKYVVMEYDNGFKMMGKQQQVALLRRFLAKLLPGCPTDEGEKSEQLHQFQEPVEVQPLMSKRTATGVGALLTLGLVALVYGRAKGKINTSLLLGYIVVSMGASFLYFSG